MLLELLPHITRLVPMADRYFSSRTASEKAQEAALAALAADVRGSLGKVSDAHGGLAGQVQEVQAQTALIAAQVALVGDDATRTRKAVESAEARIGRLEHKVETARKLMCALVALLAVAVLLLAAVLVKLHGR